MRKLTIADVRAHNAREGQELVALIEEHFSADLPTEEDVNDFLRDEDDFIFGLLGISDEEEEEEENA